MYNTHTHAATCPQSPMLGSSDLHCTSQLRFYYNQMLVLLMGKQRNRADRCKACMLVRHIPTNSSKPDVVWQECLFREDHVFQPARISASP